jgi:proteic killer suppression protein
VEVIYKTKRLEKVCTNLEIATKEHGRNMAEKIQERIAQIKAADSVEKMIQFKIGRCHSLQGNRKDQFAVNLVQPQRLIFEKIDNEIQIAKIIEITDYH